jgi:hypothetical protein
MIVNSLLVIRVGINAADRSVEFLGLGLLAISGGVLMIGEIRRHQLAKSHTTASPRVVGTCALFVVLGSIASVVAMTRGG